MSIRATYRSEIWRTIDQFEMVIEQQKDSMHVKGVFSESSGTIRYYDQRDTVRMMTEQQLEGWKFNHRHNVYVLFHHFGCTPENYTVRIDNENRLAFFRDSTFYASFGLDDQFRPHQFYHPNMDGSVSGSLFNRWATHDGLVHSAGGHPLDSNFMYQTEVWTPSKSSLKETFGSSIFDIEKRN